MIKKFALVAMVALVFSCAPEENGFYAEIEGLEDGKQVFLARLGDQNNTIPVDTTLVENGKFSFKFRNNVVQEINSITFEGVNGNLIVINEGTPLHAKVYKDSIRSSMIEGGENNLVLNEYYSILKSLNEDKLALQEEMKAALSNSDQQALAQLRKRMQDIDKENIEKRKELMKSNLGSVVSLMILSDLMQQNNITNNDAKETFASISSELKDHTLGRNLQARVSKLNDTDVGSVAPSFSGPTPDGDELALEDVLGKLTLIDFWASWCKPCRVENPNIVSVYQDYKDKGFNVLGVSLDRPNQKNAWLKAIEEDELDWYHISNLMFWNEPVAVQYGVRSIPKAFLIDENGVIVAKDLRGNQLRAKVAEILDAE